MIYLTLFWEFLKIGLFTFGGAYSAIPLIQDTVLSRGWMDAALFADMVAISESTPGPIMVNAATYVGSRQAGVAGAAVATFGVVLPSFIIIVLISIFMKKWIKSRPVQCVLRGVKPCIMGIILATGTYMGYSILFGKISFDHIGFIIMAVLLAILFVYQKIRKKEFSPIFLIVIAAVLGLIFY